nr:MAG: hypothetical protein [Microvirus Sku121]
MSKRVRMPFRKDVAKFKRDSNKMAKGNVMVFRGGKRF